MKIYTLSDPETGSIRYVGMTRQALSRRLKDHCSQGAKIGRSPVQQWLAELGVDGLRPVISLVEETDDSEREAYWIDYYRARGERLLNATVDGKPNLWRKGQSGRYPGPPRPCDRCRTWIESHPQPFVTLGSSLPFLFAQSNSGMSRPVLSGDEQR